MKEVKPIPMFLCLQLFVYGNMIFPCGSIEITSEGIVNGIWTLKDHSSVTLVCTIPPGTGLLIWRFNSSKVAECSVQSCRQISTDDGAFSFGFDTENGVYKWSINPVKIQKHNGQVFECNDGTHTKNVTAVVTESVSAQNDTEKTPSYYSISVPGIVLVAIDVVADLCVLFVVCAIGYKIFWRKPDGDEMKTINDDLKHVRTTLDEMKQQLEKVKNFQENLKSPVNLIDARTKGIESSLLSTKTSVKKIQEDLQNNVTKTGNRDDEMMRLLKELAQIQTRIADDMTMLNGKIEKLPQSLCEHGKIVVETDVNVQKQKDNNLAELKQDDQTRIENNLTNLKDKVEKASKDYPDNGKIAVETDSDVQKQKDNNLAELKQEDQTRIQTDMMNRTGKIEKVRQDLRDHGKTVAETSSGVQKQTRCLKNNGPCGTKENNEFTEPLLTF